MSKPPANPIPKASCVAHSWLTSWGIKTEFSPEKSNVLLIEGVEVHFVEKPVPPRFDRPADLRSDEAFCHRCGKRSDNIQADFGYRTPKATGKRIIQSFCRKCRGKKVRIEKRRGGLRIELSANALAENDVRTVLREVHRLTKHLGRGKPAPSRTISECKRTPSDDYEGVVMRLVQFQRTANPPDAVLQEFQPLIEREAQIAANRPAYKALLLRRGENWRDLYTYGWVYFINHYHQYAQKGPDGINRRFVVHSLRQQFTRWYEVTTGKRRPDEEITGLPVSETVGLPKGAEVETAWVSGVTGDSENDSVLGLSYRPPEFEFPNETNVVPEPTTTPAGRQKMAAAALEAGLGALPHDRMVAELSRASQDIYVPVDARHLAMSKLEEHQRTCPLCKTATVVA